MKALLLLVCVWAGATQAACRQALVLALDVSGSVDAGDCQLQITGLAAALNDADVRRAFLAMPGAPVDLAVFEWSDPGAARQILDWTTIADAAALDRAIATIAATRRQPAPPATGLGAAMRHGAALLAQRPTCWRRVLDIAGDGESNSGPRPQDVRDDPAFAGITINALAIGAAPGGHVAADGQTAPHTRATDLPAYFRAWVIRGPGAFVETARGHDDFGRAMRRKLLRELQVQAVSGIAADQ